ncbi:MAG TPA: prepilin-type N-terminal cleavage/methylation domain-containing protein [Flavobacterium sp.]|uniref:PulJ/GspJ family protein n=1 Tax=Flavobacterium sp. TaxID=239 RepID=UPI002DC05C74|nr:prepilin-type N-terminal cleavage/methylation domain-containing protein [Flavobacterium sp.]HEU4789518.1 prepilin-type N-terminal cleavage/methylation domain-containing protein [Flavobacterium sp.]
MSENKLKSFTLPELLVVMIITAIVVGMAFSVLRLVQKQIHTIETNFEKTSSLALFEQKMWQDFNELNVIKYNANNHNLLMESEMDTVLYSFQENYTLRNNDTLKLKLDVHKLFFEGEEIKEGTIDAISISGMVELPDYEIFVSKKNDLTLSMNQEDGL